MKIISRGLLTANTGYAIYVLQAVGAAPSRLATLRAANVEAHYNAALLARVDFENRLVSAVSARVNQVLDAITAD